MKRIATWLFVPFWVLAVLLVALPIGVVGHVAERLRFPRVAKTCFGACQWICFLGFK